MLGARHNGKGFTWMHDSIGGNAREYDGTGTRHDGNLTGGKAMDNNSTGGKSTNKLADGKATDKLAGGNTTDLLNLSKSLMRLRYEKKKKTCLV